LSASSLGKLEQHHQTWGFPGFPQKNQGRNYGLTPKMTILAKKDAEALMQVSHGILLFHGYHTK
jgi:hypothetical protein